MQSGRQELDASLWPQRLKALGRDQPTLSAPQELVKSLWPLQLSARGWDQPMLPKRL